MSNVTAEAEVEKEEYVPPKVAWRLPVFIDAPLSKVKKTVVDCPQCPVFLFCQEGEGGTGYVCSQCGGTGVWVDQPDFSTEIPKDMLNIDCSKHKFERADRKVLTKCAICSGGIMQLEVTGHGTRNWIIFTKHARVSVADRQKQLKEAAEKWKKWKEERDLKAAEKEAAAK